MRTTSTRSRGVLGCFIATSVVVAACGGSSSSSSDASAETDATGELDAVADMTVPGSDAGADTSADVADAGFDASLPDAARADSGGLDATDAMSPADATTDATDAAATPLWDGAAFPLSTPRACETPCSR